MEGDSDYEHKAVIHELTQGIEMAKKLRVNLNSVEAREFLIHNILSSYENALYVLKSIGSTGHPHPPALPTPRIPRSSESPGSEEFGFQQLTQEFSHQGQSAISKRKRSTTWEDQVTMCTDNGLEGNTYDGYSWRTYGQKQILGAKFPRSYYKCGYRKAQNCLATKQVQRTDEDPTVYEITYKGRHTCNHGARLAAPQQPPSPENQEKNSPLQDQPSPPNPAKMISSLETYTSDLGDATIPPSISLPSTPCGRMEDDQQLCFRNHFDEGLLQVYSPPFISPITPESNYFTEGGSLPSLDFLGDPADISTDFLFDSFFL